MRKNILKSMLLLMASVFTLTFVACGDDDETPANNGGGGQANVSELSKLLVGNTWYVVWESQNLIEIQGMTFNADGTSIGYELKRRSSDNFTQTQGGGANGTYSISGNTLTTNVDGDTGTFTATINGDGTISLKDKNGDNDVYHCLEKGKTLYDVMAEVAERKKNGEPTEGIVSSKSVVGHWNVVRVRQIRYYDSELQYDRDETMEAPYDRIVLNQDGTGEYWEYDNDDDHKGTEEYREYNGLQFHEDGKFTFTQTDSTITIRFAEGGYDSMEIISYDGDNMLSKAKNSENKGSYTVHKTDYYYLERVK